MLGRWLIAAGMCLGLLVPAVSQGSLSNATTSSKAIGVAGPSFASLSQSVLNQDYSVEQTRRFRDENGNVVTVRERLEVAANGTTRPEFAITFLAVEGEPAGSPLSLEWQQTYNRFGTLFFRHGSFFVRDLARAASNYTLHDFGMVVRAGRVARRLVVFPNTLDKAIWLVDVDSLTNVPLFVAEFDRQGQLFANIEVVSFTSSVQPITPTVPSSTVTSMLDYTAASTFLGAPSGLVDPNVMVVQDYALENIEVHDDPINGRQKLVMSYTDGVDQFMVVQSVNTLDPFAGLPSGTGGAHTIGRFRDAAVSALVFWEDSVSFHIAGRGSLLRLDDVARRIYLQALTN